VSTLILYTPLDTLTLNHDISFEIDSSIYFIKWNENDPIPVRTGPYNFSPLFLWAGDCKVNCRAFCFSFFFVEKKKNYYWWKLYVTLSHGSNWKRNQRRLSRSHHTPNACQIFQQKRSLTICQAFSHRHSCKVVKKCLWVLRNYSKVVILMILPLKLII